MSSSDQGEAMIPEEREALLASYALGTLSAPDAEDAERLIQSDPAAAREVEGFREIAELLAFAAPLHRPPAALRERVLAAARRMPATRSRRLHFPVARFVPLAGMAATLAIVSIWAVNLQQDMLELRDQAALLTAVVEADAKRLDQIAAVPDSRRDISSLATQLNETRSATSILLDPEAESAELIATGAAHGATGSYTWSASADAAVVVLRNLPPIGFGDVYRITLMDRWGNSIASESIVPAGGETITLISIPPGAWPQTVVVFATNQVSTSTVPDGPVVLSVGGTN
ncbi:MAG: hypothetical protein O3A10_03175 [Chloroflexi bacterium]|nr:hypothetical protein [Chloroflexota bacterium]MDA1145091.1 hypothetical protein [Chloroflexota bacterium]